MTASIVHDWFGWPDGAVLTNLVATGLCIAFGAWRLVRHLRRLHDRLDELHAKHDALRRHVEAGVVITPKR